MSNKFSWKKKIKWTKEDEEKLRETGKLIAEGLNEEVKKREP